MRLIAFFLGVKKPRLSLPPSDDEDEDEVEEVKSSFTKRLTHFKKSPAKSSEENFFVDSLIGPQHHLRS